MNRLTAWSNSSWIPQELATIALDDLGFMQGAVIVDRLRTCGGRLLDAELHIARFLKGCQMAGIQWPAELELQSILEECVAANRACFAGSDFSVVSLATPGRISDASNSPTILVHAAPIDWRKLAVWYRTGQPLSVAAAQNVPKACWPPTIKTRARMHYYLADRELSQSEQHAGAVLLDSQGHVTDTSTANVILVEGDRLVCPPLDSILNGICLQRTLQMASASGIQVVYESIAARRALDASEILLCGSTGIMWAAESFAHGSESTVFDHPTQGNMFPRLRDLWFDALGLNYELQALEQANH